MSLRKTISRGMLGLLGLTALVALPHAFADQELHNRYKLRPGDTLDLQYRLTSDLNQTVVVQPDNYVSLNVAGEVEVGGLTLPEATTGSSGQKKLSSMDPSSTWCLKSLLIP